MYRKLSAPLVVQWEVTEKCNYNCIHCYNYWCHDPNRNSFEGSIECLWGKIVDEIICNKIFHVVITGGEPLLVWDKLLPYIKKLILNRVSVSINSNVSLLTEDMAKTIKNLGITSMLVSLPCVFNDINDKITNVKESATKTINGIKILLHNKIPFSVNMVVTKINKDYIIDSAKELKKYGVKTFAATKSATPFNSEGFIKYRLSNAEFKQMLYDLLYIKKSLNLKISSLEAYALCSFNDKELYQIFKTRHCTAGKIICSIGYNGLIRPCSHSSTSYGDISLGISSSWDNMSKWRSNELLPKKCNGCNKKYVCGGGCKVEAEVQTGKLNEPDPYANFSFDFDDNIISNEQKDIDITSNYILSDKVRWRIESFGVILFVSVQQWSIITFDFYNILMNNKVINIEVISEKLSLGVEDALTVLNILARKKIIRRY